MWINLLEMGERTACGEHVSNWPIRRRQTSLCGLSERVLSILDQIFEHNAVFFFFFERFWLFISGDLTISHRFVPIPSWMTQFYWLVWIISFYYTTSAQLCMLSRKVSRFFSWFTVSISRHCFYNIPTSNAHTHYMWNSWENCGAPIFREPLTMAQDIIRHGQTPTKCTVWKTIIILYKIK